MGEVKLTDGMPVTGADLLVPRVPGDPAWGLRVSDRFEVSNTNEIPWELAKHRSRYHGAGICYRVPAHLRAAAWALEHPGHTVSGFAALTLYGLSFFVDGCDTVLTSPRVRRTQGPTAARPKLVRADTPPSELWHVTCRGTRVPVVVPGLAVVQALQELRRGSNGWEVLDVGEARFVRAVQLLDATQAHLNINPLDVLRAARNRLDLRWVAEALAASSQLADSPKETEMRLIAAALAEKYGLVLQEQVPVKHGGTWVTSFDLALIDAQSDLKVGLMYDGEHHAGREQMQKDSLINIETGVQGWRYFRFTRMTLPMMYNRLDAFFASQLGPR